MAGDGQTNIDVARLYVALFGRAPDTEGLHYWSELRAAGSTMAQLANLMYGTSPSRAYYPESASAHEIVRAFYVNVLGRSPDAQGWAFWESKLLSPGASEGTVISEMVSVVANYGGNDTAGKDSQSLFNNRVAVAQYFAQTDGAIDRAAQALTLVTKDPATIAIATATIDISLPPLAVQVADGSAAGGKVDVQLRSTAGTDTVPAGPGVTARVDLSARSGPLDVTLDTAQKLDLTLTAASDLVRLSASVGSGQILHLGAGDDFLIAGAMLDHVALADAGPGFDTLRVENPNTLTLDSVAHLSGFELLDVTGQSGSITMGPLGFIGCSISQVLEGAKATGPLDISVAPDNFQLRIRDNPEATGYALGPIHVIGKDYSGNKAQGSAETLTIQADIHRSPTQTSAARVDLEQVQADGVENIVLIGNALDLGPDTPPPVAARYKVSVHLSDFTAETITLRGQARIELTGKHTMDHLSRVDASQLLGGFSLDVGYSGTHVTVLGSRADDFYAGAAFGNTITMGLGRDEVDLLGAVGSRDIIVLTRPEDSALMDRNGDGRFTLDDDSFDTVRYFMANSGAVADVIDVSAFGGGWLTRGTTIVTARIGSKSADLRELPGLFSGLTGSLPLAFATFDGDGFLLIDANHDGNFRAQDDSVIKLAGVTSLGAFPLVF